MCFDGIRAILINPHWKLNKRYPWWLIIKKANSCSQESTIWAKDLKSVSHSWLFLLEISEKEKKLLFWIKCLMLCVWRTKNQQLNWPQSLPLIFSCTLLIKRHKLGYTSQFYWDPSCWTPSQGKHAKTLAISACVSTES